MNIRFTKFLYVVFIISVGFMFILKLKHDRNHEIYWKNASQKNEEKTLGLKAEQTGSSPDSGVTSKLKQAYDFLDTKGTNYGDSQTSSWKRSSGTYWNRIMYSATWGPGGTATEQDVLEGKTFYSGSNGRTIKTGTGGDSLDYSLQQYVKQVDSVSGDYTGEESTWTNTNSTSGSEVWYDTRTGLYWARSEPTTLTNSFSSPSTGYCDFFNTGTYPTRGEYGTSGTDPDCGNAINACATLSLASTQGESADTDWYLPSQKELIQAYISGMYNQAGSTFTTANDFWSSTERSSTTTWKDNFSVGRTYFNDKTSSTATRCVRRD